ncbi:hypothetical protein PanWU01x14_326350 [Parasponia andersonii]|uniref:Uncharacterized protein n=1 Tax=Parasponia andersonii TaxID=3476 RepID=A0A2P5AJG9_PARAD|nr:hypothetical protein PanWU01x14_326350 [Parasponia andersonii]
MAPILQNVILKCKTQSRTKHKSHHPPKQQYGSKEILEAQRERTYTKRPNQNESTKVSSNPVIPSCLMSKQSITTRRLKTHMSMLGLQASILYSTVSINYHY